MTRTTADDMAIPSLWTRFMGAPITDDVARVGAKGLRAGRAEPVVSAPVAAMTRRDHQKYAGRRPTRR
jgi:hypothetical protein